MNQTEDIKDLVGALSKVQGAMQPAKFNRKNPFFKSNYADFSSCMDACRDLLSSNGLSVMQFCERIDGQLHLATMIAHTSGQWLKAHLPLFPAKEDSQSVGSAITYAKRYGLSAMLGIVTGEEDDDAEAANGRPPKIDPKLLPQVEEERAKLTDSKRVSFDKRVAKICGTLDKANEAQLRTFLAGKK